MQIDDTTVAAYKAGYQAYIDQFLAGGIFDKDEATRAGLTAALATPPLPASAEAAPVEPTYWAVHSKSGMHIGLWPDKADADEALREFEGGTITPLFAAPPAAEAVVKPLDNLIEEVLSAQNRFLSPRLADKIVATLRVRSALVAPASLPDGWVSAGVAAIAAERRRQIEQEGWTPEHDDTHASGELAIAAACYVLSSSGFKREALWEIWPESWGVSWFKPTDCRRDLVKAGALIAAEIARLDRLQDAPANAKGGE